jgi:hypothetical protein
VKNAFMKIGAVAVTLMCSSAQADTLLEVDFSGSGPAAAFSSSDLQVTAVSPAVTFTAETDNVKPVTTWTYDGTGTAVAQGNVLNTGPNFGSTSRFDIALDSAAAGMTYTITSIEIDIRANNDEDINFAGGYRDLSGDPQIIGGTIIATQSGADPITTYSVDMSSAGLTATAAGPNWNTTGTGRIRFLFNDGPLGTVAPVSDNFQVAGFRIIGDVSGGPGVLLGDVDLNGVVNFLDITPFIGVLSSGGSQAEADCNEDGMVDFLDITPFIGILSN